MASFEKTSAPSEAQREQCGESLTAPVTRAEELSHAPKMELSEKEVAELKARVTLVNGVVVFREVEIVTPATLEVMLPYADELAAEAGVSILIVDVTQSRRPDASARERMGKLLRRLHNIRLLMLVTGRNFFANAVAKFIFAGSLPFKITVLRTMEEAWGVVGRHE